MVDSIRGPGGKTIIITHSKPKEAAKKTKENSFDKKLDTKSTSESTAASKTLGANHTQPAALLNQSKLAHMQRVEEIARQIQEGTYQMVDPATLADRLFSIIKDKKTREKFIRKFLDEETETSHGSKKTISDLELKKLVFLVKNADDETFDDEELEKLLKELT